MDTLLKDIKCLLEEKYRNVKTEEYFIDIERLKGGEPLAYVIGHVDFLHCRIDLSCKTLIPRDETEFWVEKIIKELKSLNPPPPVGGSDGVGDQHVRILDLFSGSGCIGISLLTHIDDADVTFTDITESCCDQINRNLQINKLLSLPYTVICSDVFDQLHKLNSTFDYIFANPPYIAREKRYATQKSVLEYEPHDALFSSEDGLFYIKKLINEAHQYLNQEGSIFIEFDSWQKYQIEEYLTHTNNWKSYSFIDDQYDHPRMLRLKKN